MKLIETYESLQNKRLQPVWNLVPAGSPKPPEGGWPEDIASALSSVLSLGAELMSSTLAVKLLWKAAALDGI